MSYKVDLDRLQSDMIKGIKRGRMGEYTGVVVLKLINDKVRNVREFSEDFALDMTVNVVEKLNRIFREEMRFDIKAPLQLLKYIKGAVNYAYLETRRKNDRDSERSVEIVDTNVYNISSPSMAEELYRFKYEMRLNGNNIDLYEMI